MDRETYQELMDQLTAGLEASEIRRAQGLLELLSQPGGRQAFFQGLGWYVARMWFWGWLMGLVCGWFLNVIL